MGFRLRVAARSDVGLVREGNEDSAYAGDRLQVVADGMGGHAGGEVASALAIRAVLDLDTEDVAANVESALSLGVARANHALQSRIEDEPALSGMGTTLTAAYNDGERLVLAHVGDSRAYRLRDGSLEQLTRDHTWVQSLVDDNRITAEEAEHHPQRSVLLQAIDGRGDLEPDLVPVGLEIGDRLLICSDGLSDYVDDDVIRTGLGAGEPGDAADRLVEAALTAGAPDNVTVVVADVLDEADGTPSVGGQLLGAVTTPPAPQDMAAAAAEAHHEVDGRADAEAATPRRRRRWRWLVATAVVLAALAGLAWGATSWWSQQWYVGVHDGRIAVFQGLPDPVLGIDLSRLEQVYPAQVDRLPEFTQERLEAGITADDEDAARQRADELTRAAAGFRT